MTISTFELFKIGVGPSSSHTVGPMLAAGEFASKLVSESDIANPESLPAKVQVTLYGALSLTGRGHATDRAVVSGLAGFHPATIDNDNAGMIWQTVRTGKQLSLVGCRSVSFDPEVDVVFVDEPLPEHPNGLLFEAWNGEGAVLASEVWFSLGGGFIATKEQLLNGEGDSEATPVPYPFDSAKALLELCEQHKITIADLVLANELALGSSEEQIDNQLHAIWTVMEGCIDRGCRTTGELPGGLQVQRRAPGLYQRWLQSEKNNEALQVMDWVSMCALAVNEENAAGGRVVTAPTNGAAGVIPAVFAFYQRYDKNFERASIRQFFLTAAAVGMLYKRNASISAAEVGCQGEIGVASSMAAAALTAVWGGSMSQVENAAEIAMEHHLGMTCDPVAGLVQIPCIERNIMGAIKAISAARLAISGDGLHKVALDQVIATMYQTGRDMQDMYKETSLGGLAVNVVYC